MNSVIMNSSLTISVICVVVILLSYGVTWRPTWIKYNHAHPQLHHRNNLFQGRTPILQLLKIAIEELLSNFEKNREQLFGLLLWSTLSFAAVTAIAIAFCSN